MLSVPNRLFDRCKPQSKHKIWETKMFNLMLNMVLKLLIKSFWITFSITFLVGCSSLSVGQKSNGQQKDYSSLTEQHLTADQIKELNKKAMEKVSEHLKQLSIAAKNSGEDKVQYLASDMYLKASAALMEGDFATANLIFERLVELVPSDVFIRKKYAISLIRTGDLEKSKSMLEGLFQQSRGKDEKTGLILAGVYSSLGESKLAEKTYQKLLKINPKNEDACIFLAKNYSVQDQFKRAVQVLQSCDKRMKKNAMFSYYLGKLYLEKDNLKKAYYFFDIARKKDPSFSQAIMAMGLIKEEEKQFQQAMQLYQDHLKAYPSDRLILTRMVQLLFTEEKFAKVIPYAERLSDLEPDNLNLKVKLGILYTDNYQYSKAIAVFKELLNHAPQNDKLHYYVGAIYQETGEFEKSVEYYSRIPMDSALFQDSSIQMAQMLSALGIMDYQKNNNDKGFHKKFVSFISDRVKKLPTLTVDFHVIEAGHFESIGDIESAVESLERVSQQESFKTSHLFYLASLYEKNKNFQKSTDLVMKMLVKDPRDAHAWNFLGYSLVERGIYLSKAHEFIVNALAISPNDGYIRDSLGWYYFKVGETEKALEELHFAVKSVPSDTSIQKHLAVVYTHLKNFAEAKTWIVKALKSVKMESERQELENVLKDLEVNRVPASFQFSID